MLSLIREYSLDVWDWIVGKRYPRQERWIGSKNQTRGSRRHT